MSETEPGGPYVYQPFGMQDKEYWRTGRIYGVGGFGSSLTVCRGLTKDEAERIVAALKVEK